MYIQKNRRNNTVHYYLSKSTRDTKTGRSITHIVESLGSKEELIAKHGQNIDQYLKEYAKKRTKEEKEKNEKFNIQQYRFDTSHCKKNIGYLFIDKICKQIGLNKICKYIEDKEKLNFNLYKIVLCIVCRDIYDSTINKELFTFTNTLYDNPVFSKQDVSKAIKVLCKHNAYIQKNLYKNACNKNNKDFLIYDCSNYGSVGASLEKIKYKTRYSHNITIGKIFMDQDLLPCGFILENDMLDNKEDCREIMNSLKYRFKDSILYILPDCITSKTDKSIFNRFPDNKKLSYVLPSDLDEETIDFCLTSRNWHKLDSNKLYDLNEIYQYIMSQDISMEELYDFTATIFYKCIKKDNKFLFSAFSFEMQHWMWEIQNYHLKKFQRAVEDRLAFVERNNNDLDNKTQDYLISDIKDDETKIHFFDDTKLRAEEEADGFCVMYEDICPETFITIVKAIYAKYNKLDYLFEQYKAECVIDKNLTFKESILSSFLTSYISVFVFRFLENKLENKFWHGDIIDQLENLNIIKLQDDIWAPSYTKSNLLDMLCDLLDIDVEYNIITKDMLDNWLSK